jgi:hypothetical protein
VTWRQTCSSFQATSVAGRHPTASAQSPWRPLSINHCVWVATHRHWLYGHTVTHVQKELMCGRVRGRGRDHCSNTPRTLTRQHLLVNGVDSRSQPASKWLVFYEECDIC